MKLNPAARRAMMWAITVGLLLIGAGTLMPLLSVQRGSDLFRYIYTTGAVIVIIGRLLTPYEGSDMRLKRLLRIEAWSGICFCVAAFFLFYDSVSLRDWLAFTLAGGAIQCYASFMIPRVAAKANSSDSQTIKKSK